MIDVAFVPFRELSFKSLKRNQVLSLAPFSEFASPFPSPREEQKEDAAPRATFLTFSGTLPRKTPPPPQSSNCFRNVSAPLCSCSGAIRPQAGNKKPDCHTAHRDGRWKRNGSL